jgi:DNA replication and repair protein RecF
MFLKNLLLCNFRNYSLLKLAFSDHLNVICGANAIGKTNLLEAIYLLSTGRSFRTLNLNDLIKHNEKYFHIEAEIESKNISQTIKIYYDGKNRKITYNTNVYSSFNSLLGIFPSSLYSVDDLNLIKGKPILRRKFLNLHLAQKDPLYVYHYQRFYKALKQRNYILKNSKTHLLKPFDIELSRSGSYLMHSRKKFIEMLKEPIFLALKKITPIHIKTKIKYIPTVDYKKNELNNIENKYFEMLQKNQKRDLDFKTTSLGPHRDDFYILINEKLAKNFASEAQKKLLLYAIRFAEWQLLSPIYKQKVPFLIDDFDAHLDEIHKNNLKKTLRDFSQVFITLPKSNEYFDNAHFITLNKN